MTEAAAGKLKGADRKVAVKNRLEDARDNILGLEVINIQLDNEDDAYIVFETLNTRGKDLEPKDLIKNLLTKLLKPQNQDVDPAKIKWKAIVDGISSSSASMSVSTYLHHFWLSKYEYTPEKSLFYKFKRQINTENAENTLDSLVADVEIYRRIAEPDIFSWDNQEESLKESLKALSMFKVRQPTPMILSILRAHRDKTISLKQAKDTMLAIERFHFMHTAVAGLSSSGGVSMMYAAAARELSNETDAQKRAKALRNFQIKIKQKSPLKEQYLSGFRELRYSASATRDRQLIRYILRRMDEKIRKDAAVDYSKMTIEHIAPQNPKNGKANARYAEVGNLVLVSEGLNGKLKNKLFVEKKSIMLNSKMPIDEVIEKETDWTDKEIKKRTEYIAGLLYEA